MVRGAALAGVVLAGVVLAAPGSAWAASGECQTEDKMAKCCSLFEKSLHGSIYQFEHDLADQCKNEIEGTRDQLSQNQNFNACIPEATTNEELSRLFRGYVENHRDFWDRPARFGMIDDWSLHWPCTK